MPRNSLGIALFDSHSLFADMYQNPSVYLNGTAPLNITGCVQPCVYALNASTTRPTSCTIVNGTAMDTGLSGQLLVVRLVSVN